MRTEENSNQLHGIHASGAYADWIGRQLDGLSCADTLRGRLSAACLHVALSHHVAIASLFRDQRPASACALLRPLIDAYLRGRWIQHIASDQELEGACDGNDPPGTLKIMKLLEDAGVFSSGLLTGLGTAIWPTVCDFTHTGIRILNRHLDGDQITPRFVSAEIQEVLAAADMWATLAALGLTELAGDDKLAALIYDYALEFGTVRNCDPLSPAASPTATPER